MSKNKNKISSRIKPLEELTIMDDYMFGIVMREKENLKPLLERILQKKLTEIQFVELQKTEKEGYLSRGVRLDLYAKDENGQIYNVEVQKTDTKNLPKRMRYYQSVIDINVLSRSVDYDNLPTSFIIFICSFDPMNEGRCIYTFENYCSEDKDITLGDEAYKIIVNTKGIREGVDDRQKELLDYLEQGIATDTYTQQLDAAVNTVKSSEERRHEYMLMMIREMELREEGKKEGLEEGRKEGRKEAILTAVDMLREMGLDDDTILKKIMQKFQLEKSEAVELIR